MTTVINGNISEIKCIDFGKLASGVAAGNDNETLEAEWRRVGEEVFRSFEDIGFAYIRNHGIPQHVIDEAHGCGSKFFALPSDIKLKYSKTVTTEGGFVEMNREKLHSDGSFHEIRESYDVKRLDTDFPTEVDGFRAAITQLTEHAKKIAYKLLRCLEIGLDVPRGTFLESHKTPFSRKNGSLLRVLHYPPISSDVKEGTIRCGAHTDYGVFTLLFQDSMGGLEVKNRNGMWVKADPIPGTILINVGDLLEIWTGGKLLATKHRVLVPEDEIKQKCERKSIVLFFHPDNDTPIIPLYNSETYPSTTAGEHLFRRYKETYKF